RAAPRRRRRAAARRRRGRRGARAHGRAVPRVAGRGAARDDARRAPRRRRRRRRLPPPRARVDAPGARRNLARLRGGGGRCVVRPRRARRGPRRGAGRRRGRPRPPRDLHRLGAPAALIRAVLLDAVGTLVALREPVGASYARIAAAHGVRIGAWRLEEAFRRVHTAAPPLAFPDASSAEVPARERAAWRELARRTFLSADSAQRFDDFDACFDALWRHFAAPEAWALRDGAAAALAVLRASGRRA